jgi:hypothetical protein
VSKVNERLMGIAALPYQLSIAGTMLVGLSSIPLVFHKETAVWFCQNFVKRELPDDLATLDTMFKVGTWTWEWMEPMIGTASFVILAMQLTRSHMQSLDMKPFGRKLESWRADYLCHHFPRYEREIVRDYSKSDPWGRDTNIARQGFPANSVISHRSKH